MLSLDERYEIEETKLGRKLIKEERLAIIRIAMKEEERTQIRRPEVASFAQRQQGNIYCQQNARAVGNWKF